MTETVQISRLFLKNQRPGSSPAAVWFWMHFLPGSLGQALSPCISSSISQTGQGSVSIPIIIIIIIKWEERKEHYLSALTHVTCFFTANSSFSWFGGYKIKSEIRVSSFQHCAMAHEGMLSNGHWKIWTIWNIPPKHPKLIKSTNEITGVCAATAFSRRKPSEEQHYLFRSGGWTVVLLPRGHNPDFSYEMTCFFISPYGLGCYGM